MEMRHHVPSCFEKNVPKWSDEGGPLEPLSMRETLLVVIGPAVVITAALLAGALVALL
jgi:hypothetical protein